MQRIQTVNRHIDKFGPGKDGFRSAVPGVSEPTYLSANWCDAVQESLVRVIEAAGMIPSASHDQFRTAIQSLIATALYEFSGAGTVLNLANFPTLKAAINALPASGGVILVPVGRFQAGAFDYDTNYMSKANVRLLGVKMPALSVTCDRLQGGSIIEGRFNAFADNFGHENIGYDSGKYVIDTYFGGVDTHTANHPLGNTWDAFAFAQPNQVNPLPMRRGFYARNVIALNRDPFSVGHAMLMEGFDGGIIDNVTGVGSIHPLVIKASNAFVGKIFGYCGSAEHVIVKSDAYSPCLNVDIDSIHTDSKPPSIAPWFPVISAQYSLLINPQTASMSSIKIRSVRLRGASVQLCARGLMNGANPVFILDDFKVESCEADGLGVDGASGVIFTDLALFRCAIDTLTIKNVADGLIYKQYVGAGGFGAQPLLIGNLNFGGSITGSAIKCLGYGRVVANNILSNGTMNILYAIDDTARIHVGRESIVGTLTAKFSNAPPALTAGWEQVPNNSRFRCVLENYGVKFTGYLRPVAGGSANVCTLPPYLRTVEATRLLAYAQGTGGKHGSVLANVDGQYGYLAINNAANIAGAELALSLDGLNWSFD